MKRRQYVQAQAIGREQGRQVTNPHLPPTQPQLVLLAELHWKLGTEAPTPRNRGDAEGAIRAAKAAVDSRQRE